MHACIKAFGATQIYWQEHPGWDVEFSLFQKFSKVFSDGAMKDVLKSLQKQTFWWTKQHYSHCIHLLIWDLLLSHRSAAAHPHSKSLCWPWQQQQQLAACTLPQKQWLEDMITKVLEKRLPWRFMTTSSIAYPESGRGRFITWTMFLERNQQKEENHLHAMPVALDIHI